eukprot:comp22679_c0_seq1/m.35081 comp22679_c0_seq1/g.35081  ORF comp22679_c0_seq1/g.35081 comp22679_c0_seq1/m.35081 type:complete len:223 (-) comp22679_c0_seq1:596-1264(-)
MAENIFLFVPNLIGFARVILALASFYYAPSQPWTTMWLYAASCFADALDGHAARYFKQSTKFGAVLDMVTDRCTTSCLFINLAVLYGTVDPIYIFLFQCLLALDIGSHWLHMYTTMAKGGGSHKEVTNPLLRLYYYKPILFTLCGANDGFFCSLYMIFFEEGPLIPYLNVGVWRFFVTVCFPMCALKQTTSVIQLYNAAIDLGEIDVKERAAAAAKEKTKAN